MTKDSTTQLVTLEATSFETAQLFAAVDEESNAEDAVIRANGTQATARTCCGDQTLEVHVGHDDKVEPQPVRNGDTGKVERWILARGTLYCSACDHEFGPIDVNVTPGVELP